MAICTAPLAAPDDLLRNGDFSQTSAEGGPLHWRTHEAGQGVSVDPGEKPTGCEGSLRADIHVEHPGRYGEIAQRLGGLEKNATYALEGKLKSTAPGIAFFQIKLYRDRQELKRITSDRSDTDWRTVTQDFFTGDADEVEILCRHTQSPQSVGQTAWFADVRLTRAGPPWLKIEEAVATFHSLGVYANYGGSVSPSSVCRVRYRNRETRTGSAGWT